MIAFEKIINKIDIYYKEIDKIDIENKETTIENYINLIFRLIEKILAFLDRNSSKKIEMIFSSKHRRKLRISQLLILLSKVFQILIKNYDNLPKRIKNDLSNLSLRIHDISNSLFEKINLASVRFYLDSFYMNYCLINSKFLEFIIDKLGNPLIKANIVTSCLIVIYFLNSRSHQCY